MQAGGVVTYGLLALAFLGSFLFEFGLLERLGYILGWVIHGGLLAMLSEITVISYLVVALIKYEASSHITMTNIGVTLGVYTVVQIGWDFLTMHFFGDTIMYMLAGEIKQICEEYGELCSQYGILDKNESGDNFEEVGTELNWTWY